MQRDLWMKNWPAGMARTVSFKRGESVKAYIVLKPEVRGKVTPEQIIEWSRQKMAAYKYPRVVEFVDELPVSGVGKVLKRVLREKSAGK